MTISSRSIAFVKKKSDLLVPVNAVFSVTTKNLLLRCMDQPAHSLEVQVKREWLGLLSHTTPVLLTEYITIRPLLTNIIRIIIRHDYKFPVKSKFSHLFEQDREAIH